MFLKYECILESYIYELLIFIDNITITRVKGQSKNYDKE